MIREAAEAGVRAIQFREKDLSLREQLVLAEKIQGVTKQHAVKLFINDRIDLCLAIDADGVHLPSQGFPIRVARKLLGAQKEIGLSCHSLDEVLYAQAQGADFALLGPIYDTPSKREYGPVLGIDYFRCVKQTTTIPLFAIGGIGEAQLTEVFGAGADGVAMVSHIMGASNIRKQSRFVLDRIEKLKTSYKAI